MAHDQLLEHVRERVRHFFSKSGFDPDAGRETILIREGCYCGRRFTCQTQRAVWFVEENVIKYYGDEGKFLEAETIDPHPVLRAAG